MAEIKIVYGANFGDEGKGLMTDYFCHNAIQTGNKVLVVLSNGGSQRGHTVVTPEGIRHVFHHFGSGTLVGADTFFPSHFIVNPMMFAEEYEIAKDCKIYIDEQCLVSTPFDMIINQIVEAARGDNKHGSCGLGIFETITRDEAAWKYLIDIDTRWISLNKSNEDIFKILTRIQKEYIPRRLRELGVNEIPAEWIDIIYNEDLINAYVRDLRFMQSKCQTVSLDEEDDVGTLRSYETIVFENGQGLLLDKDNKEYFPHLTPSKTGVHNPIEIINVLMDGVEGEEINIELCGVTRTYITRHGAGRLDYECKKEDIGDLVDLTNVPNPHQGSLRYGRIKLGELSNRLFKELMSIANSMSGLSKNIIKNNTYNIINALAITHMNEVPVFGLPDGEWLNRVYVSDGETRNSVEVME